MLVSKIYYNTALKKVSAKEKASKVLEEFNLKTLNR